MGNGKPIFYDEERRRWRRTRRVMEIAGALFAFVLVVFIVDIFRNPDLGASLLPDRHPIRHAIRQSKPAKATPVRLGRKKRVAALGKQPDHYDPLRAAFYANGDPTGFASLHAHYKEIDLLIPEGLMSDLARRPPRYRSRSENFELDAHDGRRAADYAAPAEFGRHDLVHQGNGGASRRCWGAPQAHQRAGAIRHDPAFHRRGAGLRTGARREPG